MRYSLARGRARAPVLPRVLFAALAFVLAALPRGAEAHEVYVLSQGDIARALASPPFNLFAVGAQNLGEFAFWTFVAALVVFVVFFASVSRSLERVLDPYLARLPRYAPAISRITIGLSFLAAAHYGALFGPELPLSATFGSAAPLISALLVVLGLMLVFGAYARAAAAAAAALFAAEVVAHGSYMLTYANYLGELVLLLILGAHALAFHDRERDEARAPAWLFSLKERLTPYAFLILRVAFGVSLLFASLYAKIAHNRLALAVAELPLAGHPHSLAEAFGLEPHFLVLGAAIVEILIALFFILGVEIRFTSIFLLFWLSLSLWYFGEVVWPHVILIGIPIAFIFYGYDRYSLEGWLFKKDGREPVL